MKKALLALAVLISATAVAEAQVKSRWRLQWQNEKPQLYTYRTANDKYENFWYVIYTIENTTDEIVPVIVDVLLYTESGKELQNDVRRVDQAVIKEERESPRRAEPLKYGRFYANVIDGEVEHKIIEYHARLGNRSPGIVLESIEAFKKGFAAEPPPEFKGHWKKGDRLYLNPREMREHRWIQPGQKLMGLAIFKGVDPRAHVYELHVSGLVDIIKITAVTEDEWKMEYEPITLKVRWMRAGDEFEIENDVLSRLSLLTKEYVVKKIGPIASKDTVDNLVLTLANTIKKEKEWVEAQAKPEEIAQRRAKDHIDPLDTRIMASVFKLAVDKDFGYDITKDILENERAVWRIHEWWITNRTKLVFNEVTNRFEVKEDPLPAAVEK
jgi:hypothetical protein